MANTTPPRSTTQLPRQDTPLLGRSGRSGTLPEYTSNNLGTGRVAVLNAAGPIYCIEVEDFWQSVLRFPPELGPCDVTLNKVVEMLKKQGILTPQNQWKGFEQDPKGAAGKEPEVFMPLTDIFTSILESVTEICQQKPILGVSRQSSRAPDSERTNTSIPDFILTLPGEITKKSDWADIAATFEFKKQGSDAEVQDVS